jgi:hypothetical protein
MMRVEFRSGAYQTIDWFQAWLTKNGRSKLVLVGLPFHTWKVQFEEYAATRGFQVTWR